jgi:hypothetical protein
LHCPVFSRLRIDETLASIILQSIKERGKGGREKGSKSKSEAQKPNLGHKGPREQIMLQRPPRSKEAYQGRKMTGLVSILIARTLPDWYDLTQYQP